MKEIYEELIKKPVTSANDMKSRKRIAIPSKGYLDIMKLERVVEVVSKELGCVQYYLAVAKICPGQASFRLYSDGRVELNKLMKARQLRKEEIQNGNVVCGLEGMVNGYWAPMYGAHTVSKNQMKELQKYLPKTFKD